MGCAGAHGGFFKVWPLLGTLVYTYIHIYIYIIYMYIWQWTQKKELPISEEA